MISDFEQCFKQYNSLLNCRKNCWTAVYVLQQIHPNCPECCQYKVDLLLQLFQYTSVDNWIIVTQTNLQLHCKFTVSTMHHWTELETIWLDVQPKSLHWNHSTETALLCTLDNVCHSSGIGKFTVLVSLHLSSIFDTIDHTLLTITVSRISLV